jgi:2,3-bisphosphoglycerate-independent phosphoglycerate mutase
MLLLVIRDGWGVNGPTEGNAITKAEPKYYQHLIQNYPNTVIDPCGEAVGLPAGQMGNSEVGHLNLGAGRIVYQDLLKISKDLESGEFSKKPNIAAFVDKAKQGGRVHLLGLISDGGVHSHIEHIKGFVHSLKEQNITELYIHAFMDGRDTPPDSGKGYLEDLEKTLKETELGSIATVSGRFYAMDRDQRWERVEKAYKCLVHGEGEKAKSVSECMQDSYQNDVTDEFVLPTVINEEGIIKKGDSVFFMNFRPDRAREITMALLNDGFEHFPVETLDLNYLTMTPYATEINAPIAYSKDNLKNTLSEIISKSGMKQLKIAETEKYAHVTYFLNGGKEEPFKGEDRILVPSPKVATYDLQPEMSAYEVTEKLEAAIRSNKYDLMIVNYANPDMVGHTGFMDAAIKAIHTVDECVKTVVEATLECGGAVMLTADHGNSDEMLDAKGAPMTAHSLNKVDFILVPPTEDKNEYKLREGGILADVTPTILEWLNLECTDDMDGKSLIIK